MDHTENLLKDNFYFDPFKVGHFHVAHVARNSFLFSSELWKIRRQIKPPPTKAERQIILDK
jgi:hypothetical protein